MGSLLLLVLLAQPITVAGRTCVREIVNGDIYVECGQGGYGLQFRPEGVYELTKGRMPRSWRARKLPPLPPELDPLIPSVPAVVAPATATADATAVHRVLVAYTARAESAQGGPDNMLSLIVAAVAAANLTYTNVAVPLRLDLADVVKVTYTEGDPATDLSRFRGTTDGYMDEVHARRDAVKADVMSLIGSGWASRGACGIGYLMSGTPSTSYAASAFSLTDRSCIGQLTFVHEIGHNQGLHHDPANASPTCPPNYNCGHRVSGQFRTVMAYGSETRVPYLSSPLVLRNGIPTGTVDRDNARRLRNTMATVEAFRTGEPTTAPPAPPPPPPQTVEQLSITSSSMSVAPGQPYDVTCSVDTTGLHEWRCDGQGYFTCADGVCAKTVPYTMNTTGRTHTVSAKLLSEGSSGTPITKTIFVAASTQTCAPWTISPASATVGSSGGTVPVSVTGTAGCGWTASSNASWIAVSPTSGTGNGTATLTVTANPNTSQRIGTAAVAGQTVTITQEAAVVSNPCVDDPFVASVTTWPVDTAVTSVTHTDTRGCTKTSTRPVAGGEAADDFNRPDGPAGSNWAWQVSEGTIRSGSLGSSSDALAIGWWTQGTFPADQFSEAVVSPGFAVGTQPAVTLLQVFVRRQDSGFARYGFHFNQLNSETWIYELKYDGISPGVVIATAPAPQPWQPGDVVRIEAQGNQIRGLVNGTVVISGTHDTLVGGRPGVVINPLGPTSLQSYDAWRGGPQ